MTALWVEAAANADVILASLMLITFGVLVVWLMVALTRLRRRVMRNEAPPDRPVVGGHMRVPAGQPTEDR